MVTEITNERLPEHLGQVRPNFFFSRAPSIRNNSVWILSRWLSLKFHVATVQGSNLSKELVLTYPFVHRTMVRMGSNCIFNTQYGGIQTESKRTLDMAISATMHFLRINPKYDARSMHKDDHIHTLRQLFRQIACTIRVCVKIMSNTLIEFPQNSSKRKALPLSWQIKVAHLSP